MLFRSEAQGSGEPGDARRAGQPRDARGAHGALRGGAHRQLRPHGDLPPGPTTWDYETGAGKTALLEAVEDGATDTVSFLVAQGASPNHETKAEGVTAIMHAARKGKDAMVPALVDNGANVNHESAHHRTALMEAIAAGDGREVFAMTEAGQLAVVGAGSGLCAILAGNSAAGGGEIELDDCEAAAETGDGRSFWAQAPNGQLTLAGGSYCMVLAGGAGGNGADTASWFASREWGDGNTKDATTRGRPDGESWNGRGKPPVNPV